MRTATAGARVLLGRRVFELVASNQMAKGDVLTVAQLAGERGSGVGLRRWTGRCWSKMGGAGGGWAGACRRGAAQGFVHAAAGAVLPTSLPVRV